MHKLNRELKHAIQIRMLVCLLNRLKKGMKMFIIKSVQPSKSKKKLIQMKIKNFNRRRKVKIPVIISSITKTNRNQVGIRISNIANGGIHLGPTYLINIESLAFMDETSWGIIMNKEKVI